MFENRIKKYLKEDEQVIEVVRKYMAVFLGPIIFSTVLIIASFFLIYPLFHYWGSWGVGIFIVLIVVGLFIAFKTFYVYSFNVFIITDMRIIDIDQKGFFERTVSETTYEKIQDVSFKIKGMIQTMLHFGSVIIQTAGTQANIELHGVKDPEIIQGIIIDLQRELKSDAGIDEDKIDELVNKIRGSLKEIDKEKENDDSNQ